MKAFEEPVNSIEPAFGLNVAPTAQAHYWPQLDGFRALSFLLVLANHVVLTPPQQSSGWWLFALKTLMGWGWMGVQLFFLLSGFLITTLLLRESQVNGKIDLGAFLIRRALRIWPLYYLILAVNFVGMPLLMNHGPLAFGGKLWAEMTATYLPAFVVFLGNFLMPDYGGVKTVLSVVILWSVCVEEQFYLLWGAVLRRFQCLSTLGWFVWALLLVAPLARWGLFMATGKNSAFYFDTLGQMDSLAMGAGLALLKASGKLPVAWIQRWGVVLMTMPVLYYLALAGLAPNLGENQPSMIFIFTGNALFGGLLLLGLFYWAPARQLFSHPWAVWVGRYTYAMYLTHMLAIFAAEKLVKHYLGSVDTPLNWLALILLSFALVCLFAFIGWHGVEKWFQALRKSFVRVGS